MVLNRRVVVLPTFFGGNWLSSYASILVLVVVLAVFAAVLG